MRFDKAREELLATLVAGGMSERDAHRKLHNWTTRIERRTAAHLAHHETNPDIEHVLEHVAVQFDDLATEAEREHGSEAWDGTPAPVVAYRNAAGMVRRAKHGVESV